MTKMNILPADTYTVVNKSILTDIDREILINLYQPIVGSEDN
jgi:replication initiation and membrane attachment protein DnaB